MNKKVKFKKVVESFKIQIIVFLYFYEIISNMDSFDHNIQINQLEI